MSNFKNIINYLRYTRRNDEAKVKNRFIPAIIVNENYNGDEVNKPIFKNTKQ